MKNLDSINKNRPTFSPPIVKNGSINSVSLLSKPTKHRGKFFLKIIIGLILGVIAVLGILAAIRATNLTNKIFVGNKTSFFQKIRAVLGAAGNVRLEGENQGQINILLLGIGGEGHDGPFLSDTMIVAQIRPDITEISLTSIPRDYLVKMPDSKTDNYAKINNAFSAGYTKNKNWAEGGSWARQAAQTVTGLNIPYFTVIDFEGFRKAVDKIGGVDVDVEKTFTDSSFPNDRTLGYLPPITFNRGRQHFNGEHALIFARSRHAAGSEGSDFARSQRQQKIIQAFKQKIFSLNIISDAGKINQLLGIFADHFHTNLDPKEIMRIYSLIKEKGGYSFLSLSLDQDTGLVCPKIMEDTGAYVLVPCPNKSAADIKNFFLNAFALGRIYREKAVLWLGNSGSDKKIYADADAKLKATGLTVWEVPYFGESAPFEQNIFFQVNPKAATAEFVKNTLNAKELALPPPGLKIDKNKVDIIIILGNGQ